MKTRKHNGKNKAVHTDFDFLSMFESNFLKLSDELNFTNLLEGSGDMKSSILKILKAIKSKTSENPYQMLVVGLGLGLGLASVQQKQLKSFIRGVGKEVLFNVVTGRAGESSAHLH